MYINSAFFYLKTLLCLTVNFLAFIAFLLWRTTSFCLFPKFSLRYKSQLNYILISIYSFTIYVFYFVVLLFKRFCKCNSEVTNQPSLALMWLVDRNTRVVFYVNNQQKLVMVIHYTALRNKKISNSLNNFELGMLKYQTSPSWTQLKVFKSIWTLSRSISKVKLSQLLWRYWGHYFFFIMLRQTFINSLVFNLFPRAWSL